MRRAAPMFILIVACGAAAAGPQSKKARLATYRGAAPTHRSFALPDGEKATDEPKGMLAKIERKKVILFDVNGNGRFNDLGIDGWTQPGPASPYLYPLEEVLPLGDLLVTVSIDRAGPTLRYEAKRMSGDAAVRAALRELNDRRTFNGLMPVRLDPELTKACQSHAAYMSLHGRWSHGQVRGKAGYSEAGNAAARASCVREGGDAVAWFWNTLFHRYPLVRPHIRGVGLGVAGAFTALDATRAETKGRWREPVAIPGPDSTSHGLSYSTNETPRLHPDANPQGNPITLTFAPVPRLTKVKAELRIGGPKGRAVEALVSWPGNPAHVSQPRNGDSICLAPRERLRRKTRYFVRMAYELAGKPDVRTWYFTTAAK